MKHPSTGDASTYRQPDEECVRGGGGVEWEIYKGFLDLDFPQVSISRDAYFYCAPPPPY